MPSSCESGTKQNIHLTHNTHHWHTPDTRHMTHTIDTHQTPDTRHTPLTYNGKIRSSPLADAARGHGRQTPRDASPRSPTTHVEDAALDGVQRVPVDAIREVLPAGTSPLAALPSRQGGQAAWGGTVLICTQQGRFVYNRAWLVYNTGRFVYNRAWLVYNTGLICVQQGRFGYNTGHDLCTTEHGTDLLTRGRFVYNRARLVYNTGLICVQHRATLCTTEAHFEYNREHLIPKCNRGQFHETLIASQTTQ